MLKRFVKRANQTLPDDKINVTVQNHQLMIQREEEEVRPLLEDGKLAIQISDKAKLLLAAKIARLVPELADGEKWKLFEYTTQVLETLCEEQLPRVRQMIAEELKAEPQAPHRLMLRLAQDHDLKIAAPVLECSPVLTDDDLVTILHACTIEGVMEAVAKRERLTSRISHMILESRMANPITRLLENHGAEISDRDFHQLELDVPEHTEWQTRLMKRPDLPMRTVNAIASLLSEALLHELSNAHGLSPRIRKVVHRQIEERLAKPSYNRKREEIVKVKESIRSRDLSPQTLEDALFGNQRHYVVEGLASLTGYDVATIERMLRSGSAKLITALSWKAGCSMRFAMELQLRLGRIHHRDMLRAKRGHHYPLEVSEMKDYLSIYE